MVESGPPIHLCSKRVVAQTLSVAAAVASCRDLFSSVSSVTRARICVDGGVEEQSQHQENEYVGQSEPDKSEPHRCVIQ